MQWGEQVGWAAGGRTVRVADEPERGDHRVGGVIVGRARAGGMHGFRSQQHHEPMHSNNGCLMCTGIVGTQYDNMSHIEYDIRRTTNCKQMGTKRGQAEGLQKR